MYDNGTNAETTVSRRSVLKTAGGLLAGSTALAGFGSGSGAAATEGELRAELRERNDDYVAVEVWFPDGLFDEIEFPNDVFLGDAERFVVHEAEDAVSLPEDTDGLAIPAESKHIGSDDQMHGKLMYFRTGDIGWPTYDAVGSTLAVGAFPERTIPEHYWDTCPGLYANVREFTEDYVVVEGRLPDGMDGDDVAFPDDTFLGHAEQFVVHEAEDAVSLPEDTDGLARPVEMDFDNPHDVVIYFRTDDVDLSAAEGEEVTLGVGLFTERTIPAEQWYACPGHRDY